MIGCSAIAIISRPFANGAKTVDIGVNAVCQSKRPRTLMTYETSPLEIGLCSWSIGTTQIPRISSALTKLELRAVHLALGPILAAPATRRIAWINAIRKAPWIPTAAMIAFSGENYSSLETIRKTGGFVPEQHFMARVKKTVEAAKLCKKLGIKYLSTHVGFIPLVQNRAVYADFLNRLMHVSDLVAQQGVMLLFESGQESPETLASTMERLRRDHVGINFDPANILLYGHGDPVTAALVLAPWIRHLHAKDCKLHPQATANGWRGKDANLGQGDANLADVLRVLVSRSYHGPVIIERELGRVSIRQMAADIAFLRNAIDHIRQANI